MISGFILLATLSFVCPQRPIWNIGHMVNNKRQIDEFLDLGANGIETDIKFSPDGTALYTSHGFPCDCGRDCFRWDYVEDYLDYVSELTTPGHPRFRPQFILVCLDLKLKKFNVHQQTLALRSLAQKLVQHLWKNGTTSTNLKVLIHLPDTSGIPAVRNFSQQLEESGLERLNQKVGWEVYSDESIGYITGLWEKLNTSTNNWQGDGITNCLPRSTRRLREAVANREQGHKIFNKVYYWTVDRQSTIRDCFRIGVDAVMTNYPNRVVNVLQEQEFRLESRLATSEDDPFQMYLSKKRSAPLKVHRIPQMLINMEDDGNLTAIF